MDRDTAQTMYERVMAAYNYDPWSKQHDEHTARNLDAIMNVAQYLPKAVGIAAARSMVMSATGDKKIPRVGDFIQALNAHRGSAVLSTAPPCSLCEGGVVIASTPPHTPGIADTFFCCSCERGLRLSHVTDEWTADKLAKGYVRVTLPDGRGNPDLPRHHMAYPAHRQAQ